MSGFRNAEFGKAYGVDLPGGPMAGLCARSIVVVDENVNVVYTGLVPETVREPDYDKALAAL